MLFRILLILIFCPFLAQSADSLKEKIDPIVEEAKEQRLSVAIQVKDLSTEEVLYSLNPSQRMIPASTTKSFTAYAALEYLGFDYIYSTNVLVNENMLKPNGELSGDLYIKFSGDPSLTKQNLNDLISSANIKTIKGNVIIDDFVFDQYYQANGWSWDDSKFCYAAPTSAIAIDKNCFYLNLSPGKNDGENTILTGKSFSNIQNDIITRKNSNCAPELMAHPDNTYNLTGCLDINSAPIPLKIAYQDPRLMAKALISEILREQNITYDLDIIFAEFNASQLKTIAEHKSAPLAELVKQMHKNSDNVIADNLSKTLGMKYFSTQGNFANGTKAIANITVIKDIKIFDGSGGSRYNLIAPDQLVDLYILASKNQKIWSYFYNSLPISSVDEPFKNRFSSELLGSKLHAKTGSMSGITNLVGYLKKDNGQILVFSIMLNGCTNMKEAHSFIEKILVAML